MPFGPPQTDERRKDADEGHHLRPFPAPHFATSTWRLRTSFTSRSRSSAAGGQLSAPNTQLELLERCGRLWSCVDLQQ